MPVYADVAAEDAQRTGEQAAQLAGQIGLTDVGSPRSVNAGPARARSYCWNASWAAPSSSSRLSHGVR